MPELHHPPFDVIFFHRCGGKMDWGGEARWVFFVCASRSHLYVSKPCRLTLTDRRAQQECGRLQLSNYLSSHDRVIITSKSLHDHRQPSPGKILFLAVGCGCSLGKTELVRAPNIVLTNRKGKKRAM